MVECVSAAAEVLANTGCLCCQWPIAEDRMTLWRDGPCSHVLCISLHIIICQPNLHTRKKQHDMYVAGDCCGGVCVVAGSDEGVVWTPVLSVHCWQPDHVAI